jgi:hypothetical protein
MGMERGGFGAQLRASNGRVPITPPSSKKSTGTPKQPQLKDAYGQNPEGTMRETGLSDDSIETLFSRDLGKIKAALEKELPGRDFIMFMIIFYSKT